MEMISVNLANRRIQNPLKGCINFCELELKNKIDGAGDESNNEGGALFGVDLLSIDPYYQEEFLRMFGDVVVWIGSDYKVNKLSVPGRR